MKNLNSKILAKKIFVVASERIKNKVLEKFKDNSFDLKVANDSSDNAMLKKALEFIVKNYPNSIEAEEAEVLLEDVIPLAENANFKQVENGDNFKLIYYFPKENYKKIEEFKKSLNLAISDLKNIQINSSTDIYDNSSTFVVLHGLKSYDGAKGLSVILERNEAFFNNSSFVISSENYQTLQIHKNLSVYLNKKF